MPKLALVTDFRTLPEARDYLGLANSRITELEGIESSLLAAKPEDSTPYKDLLQRFNTLTSESGTMAGRAVLAEAKNLEVQGKLTTAEADLATAKGTITTMTAEVPEKANARAIEILAARGLSPLQLGLGDPDKPEKQAGLKGRDRVAAAWQKIGDKAA